MHLTSKQIEAIKLSSLNLAIGENTRTSKCPECATSGDFSITRYDLGLFYICYRASCGARGFISSRPGVMSKSEKPRKPKIFSRETTSLKPVHYKFFVNNFTILSKDLAAHGVSWCPSLQRIIYPCFTQAGYIWGYVARHYPDLSLHKEETKSILYSESTEACKVSWSRGVVSKTVVLVEDMTSAIKLSNDVTAIALLGHQVPECLWAEIADRDVIIALDADVTHKVGNILTANALKVHSIRAIPLEMDIKDMPYHKYRLFLDQVFKR